MAIRKIIESISDRSKFTLLSTGCVLRKIKYLAVFLVSLFIFLYILSFFKDGSGNWQLLWSGLAIDRKIQILGRVFADIFSNFTSLYGVTIIFLSLLQALVVMHLVFAWKHREKNYALDGASTGGVGAILGFVALGCPSCGIGLLTPLLSAIAGASAVALAEGISQLFTIAAFLLMIFTIIRLGYINYIIISSNKEEHGERS